MVREVLAGLVAQGFRRILVSNGHGGNAFPQARFELFQWWTHPDVVQAGEDLGLTQRHANWSENFSFTRVGPVPEGDKPPVTLSRTANAAATRAALGDGSYGGAYQTSNQAMATFFAAAVDAMVMALRAL